MPSKSKAQHNLMAMVANNPKAAKRLGVSQSVGKEFMKADKRKGKKFDEGGSTSGGPRSRSRAGYERLKAKETADEKIEAKKKERLDRLKEAAVYRYKKGTEKYGMESVNDPPGSVGYKIMKSLRQNIRDPIEDTLSDVYETKTPQGIEGPEAANLRARKERLGYRKGGSVSSASKRADGCATKGKTKGRFV